MEHRAGLPESRGRASVTLPKRRQALLDLQHQLRSSAARRSSPRCCPTGRVMETPLIQARPVLQVGAYGCCKSSRTDSRPKAGADRPGFQPPGARSASNCGRRPALPSRLGLAMACRRSGFRLAGLRGCAWAIKNRSLLVGKGSEGPKVHGFNVDERLAKPWQSPIAQRCPKMGHASSLVAPAGKPVFPETLLPCFGQRLPPSSLAQDRSRKKTPA